MVSNCSEERTLSKLKQIKDDVRSTMGETHLNPPSIMSIESDILRNLDLSSIIETFACKNQKGCGLNIRYTNSSEYFIKDYFHKQKFLYIWDIFFLN